MDRVGFGTRNESATRSRIAGTGGRTKATPGSAASAGSTRNNKRPRGNAKPAAGNPPCSGMRITTPRTSLASSALRAGSVTFKSSGTSLRPRSATAPARSHTSQPPPSQAAHAKLRGSTSSTTSPASSQARGTRMRCTTSGPRGTSMRVVTLPKTSGTKGHSSADCSAKKRGLSASLRVPNSVPGRLGKSRCSDAPHALHPSLCSVRSRGAWSRLSS
jgi:hypothetical protein